MKTLIIISSVAVVLIAVIFLFFRKPVRTVEMSKGKRIAYLSVMTALCAMCNIFSIDLGVKSVSLTFVSWCCFMAGYLFGCIGGFAVGFIGDVIGAIILPRGAYMPIIGIASGLWGFIPGLIFTYFKGGDNLKTIISFVICLVVCTAFLNTYGLWLLYGIGKKTFWVYLWARLPMQSFITLLNMFLSLGTLTFVSQLVKQRTVEKPADVHEVEHCVQ